jgi:predicted ABC-type transport system involved in lysophospholipase L1 biosynthesis ATPase subunit
VPSSATPSSGFSTNRPLTSIYTPEAQVIDALHNATQGRTVIVATHSAALARSADAVLSLADGTIHATREAIPA